MQEIVSHKKIAKNYMSGWFIIDFVSIIPIDLMTSGADFNQMFRFIRIGKMYKLIRLFRLIKILKLVKSNKKLMNHFSEQMRINAGSERLMFFSFFFVIFLHVSSCLFIMIGKIEYEDQDYPRWLDVEVYQSYSNIETYILATYWVMTTTSTVGYGDISPINTVERLYGCALMLIGVLSFTFISGALSSILQSYDTKQAALQEKIL